MLALLVLLGFPQAGFFFCLFLFFHSKQLATEQQKLILRQLQEHE